MRGPTHGEKVEIARALGEPCTMGGCENDCEGCSETFERIMEDLTQATVVVVDGYSTDGPGYQGRLVFVCFSGCPSYNGMLTDIIKENSHGKLVATGGLKLQQGRLP